MLILLFINYIVAQSRPANTRFATQRIFNIPSSLNKKLSPLSKRKTFKFNF